MSTMKIDKHTLAEAFCSIAERAGHEILSVYHGDFEVRSKADSSPVTDADERAEQLILEGLSRIVPDIPVVAEESVAAGYTPDIGDGPFLLVDPLDGTKEFVNRNGEFTVNIAFIHQTGPVFGVVYVPVSGVTYVGCEGVGAERRDAEGSTSIQVSTESKSPVRVVGGRSHRGASLDAFLENLGEFEMHPMGSSLKFCRVAEGAADIYPRLGPTSEWDTAAAQAVVEQAGGSVVTTDGKPLSYNEKSNILNPFFLVLGPKDHDWLGLVENTG